MFHIAKRLIKLQSTNYSQIFLSQNCKQFYDVKKFSIGPTLTAGYPLLRNSHAHFYFSSQQIKDYYKTLDVSENATQEQIKKQFHKLARLYHPDSAASSGNDEKFKEISEAYNIIGDRDKRLKYDADRNLYKQQEQSRKQYSQQQQQSQYNYQQSQYQQYQSQFYNTQRRQQEEYEPYNPYTRSRQQSQQDEARYKSYKDYQGFQNRDFDQGNMVREGFFENMKDAPELWILTGIMVLLVLRWFFLTTVEHKQKNYTGDDDFEHAQPRGRIMLRDEDVLGLSLNQLEALDATGKYLLPPKTKASIEEYRSIAKSIDYDIKKENSKKKKRPSDLGVEDKFGEDEDEDFEEKIEKMHAERKLSILEQVIEKAEWDDAEKEKKEKKVQQAKPQTYRNASSQVMYEKSAHPNLYSKFNYQERFQKKQSASPNEESTSSHPVIELNEKAQQQLASDIQQKVQTSKSEIDTIQQIDPQQLQVFGGVSKKKKKASHGKATENIQQQQTGQSQSPPSQPSSEISNQIQELPQQTIKLNEVNIIEQTESKLIENTQNIIINEQTVEQLQPTTNP